MVFIFIFRQGIKLHFRYNIKRVEEQEIQRSLWGFIVLCSCKNIYILDTSNLLVSH